MGNFVLTGLKGDNGQSFILGSGAPASITGADGDSYLDIANSYALWSRSAGVWTKVGQLLQTVNGKTGATVTLTPADIGAIAPDSSGLLPLSSFPIRTAQVTRALRLALVDLGGSFKHFLSVAGGDPDAIDGTWEMVWVEPIAPIGDLLWTAVLAYLQSNFGMTSTAATTQLQAIWAKALTLGP